MKRILSWIVLIVIGYVVSLLTSLVMGLGAYVLSLIDGLNTLLKILIYLFGGATLLSIILAPIYYGSMLAVPASEAVKESKKGTRYIVYSVYNLIASIAFIIMGFLQGEFRLQPLLMCIYYIAILVIGKNIVSEKYED